MRSIRTAPVIASSIFATSAITLGACSFSVGDSSSSSSSSSTSPDGPTSPVTSTTTDTAGATVSASEIETEATEAFTNKPDGATLDCPDDIEAKVGATTTCTWTLSDGTTLGMTATVKSITGTTVNFDFENDTAVTGTDGSTTSAAG